MIPGFVPDNPMLSNGTMIVDSEQNQCFVPYYLPPSFYSSVPHSSLFQQQMLSLPPSYYQVQQEQKQKDQERQNNQQQSLINRPLNNSNRLTKKNIKKIYKNSILTLNSNFNQQQIIPKHSIYSVKQSQIQTLNRSNSVDNIKYVTTPIHKCLSNNYQKQYFKNQIGNDYLIRSICDYNNKNSERIFFRLFKFKF